jgi:hypothetical protein
VLGQPGIYLFSSSFFFLYFSLLFFSFSHTWMYSCYIFLYIYIFASIWRMQVEAVVKSWKTKKKVITFWIMTSVFVK